MAANVQKYKVTNMAKDLDVKAKDIVEVLKDKGFDGKTSSSVLENFEINIVLQHYTSASTVEDIGAYLSSEKPSEKPAAPENKEEAPKAKPEPKAEPVAEAKPEPKAEPVAEAKSEEKKVDVKKEENVHESSEEIKSEPVKEQSKAESKEAVSEEPSPKKEQPAFEKKDFNQTRPQGNNRPQQGAPVDRRAQGNDGNRPYGDKKPFEKRPFEGRNDTRTDGRKPFTPGQGQNGQFDRKPQNGGQLSDRQFEKQINKMNREGAQLLKQEGIKAEPYPKFDKNDKFDKYSNVKFTKDGFVSDAPQQSAQKTKPKFPKPGQFTRGGVDKDDENQSVRQPSLKPVFDKDGRIKSRYAGERIEGATPTADDDGRVRIVDMRIGEVDLSKYDEKLDTLADTFDEEGGSKSGKKKPGAGASQKNQQGKGKSDSFSRDAAFTPVANKGKKGKKVKGNAPAAVEVKKFTGPVVLPEEIMISDLAAALKITTAEVIKKLLMMGLGMDQVGANKIVDFDTAYLLADEMGISAEKEVILSIEEKLFAEDDEKSEENLEPRSPVVCVMGHVDHGKTSLLDAIRDTHVTAGEAGGITQHIGAYKVRINNRDITFLDTPGHEAFTAMRARGAMATDIAILVVAADDGIMPQTVEAINHAKAAGISIIVAINKCDKPAANIDNVKQNLTNYELVPEEWGGDTICVPVSALKRTGIEELLEMVLLVADMKELKANANCAAKGIVIESKLDKGRGPVATMLVQAGTLHRGDMVIAGTAIGHVRAMCDHNGKTVKEAGPSTPVEITGLSEAPEAGEEFRVVANERMAKELIEKRKTDAKEEVFKANAKVSLDTLFSQLNDGVKDLNLIVKADVQGSVEAVKASLEKLSNEEVRVKVIHSATGGITEGDVTLAAASNAIVIGFNVRPDKNAMDSAERQEVDVRTYRVIYECIEEITAAISGMLDPEFKEVVLGHAQVRKTIHVPGIGFVAGSYVQDGKITRNSSIRVVRDGVVIFEDKISSLKRFKDDAKEVATGYECGIALERFNDIKEEDILEAFIMEEIKREL